MASHLLAQACSLCRKKLPEAGRLGQFINKKMPVWLHTGFVPRTGFVPYNTLKEKNCPRRLASAP